MQASNQALKNQALNGAHQSWGIQGRQKALQIPVIERCNMEPEHGPHGLNEIQNIMCKNSVIMRTWAVLCWAIFGEANQASNNIKQLPSMGQPPKKSSTLMAEIGDAFFDLTFLPNSSVWFGFQPQVGLANGWLDGPQLHLASSCFSGFVAQALSHVLGCKQWMV